MSVIVAATTRAAKVEAFSSWSACRMRAVSMAFTITFTPGHEELTGTDEDTRAVAAWKASLIEYELGHAQTALFWARKAEAAIAGSGSLRENSLQESSPQENPPQESSSREGSSKQNPPQESPSREGSLQENPSQEKSPRENSPQEGLSCQPFSQTGFFASVCKAAAQAEAALGCFEDAQAHYRQAIGLQQSLEGGGVPEIAVTYNDLAVLLYEMEEFDEAGDLLEQALRIQTAAYGPDSIYLSTTFNNQGLLASARGHHETAAAYYEKSLFLQRKRRSSAAIWGRSTVNCRIWTRQRNFLTARCGSTQSFSGRTMPGMPESATISASCMTNLPGNHLNRSTMRMDSR